MKRTTKYGVISDIHSKQIAIIPALEKLKEEGIDKLIINGDISDMKNNLNDSQNQIAFVLDNIGKSNIETYIQPGSHETLFAYEPVIEHFTKKYSNLNDVLKNPKISVNGHDLIFIPGSDFLCGGEYQLGNLIPSGKYIMTKDDKLAQINKLEDYLVAIKLGISKGAMNYSNMNDIKKLVNNPDKTTVFCHVPRKFNNIKDCVDVAHFWQNRVYHKDTNNFNEYTFTELSIIPGIVPKEIIQKQNKVFSYNEHSEEELKSIAIDMIKKEDLNRALIVVERYENRGNEELNKLYTSLGITKAISGHFHESAHKANDKLSNTVKENEYVSELFYNSGCLDNGKLGIVEIQDNKIKYKNINLF